jgi:hypothetical protein
VVSKKLLDEVQYGSAFVGTFPPFFPFFFFFFFFFIGYFEFG